MFPILMRKFFKSLSLRCGRFVFSKHLWYLIFFLYLDKAVYNDIRTIPLETI